MKNVYLLIVILVVSIFFFNFYLYYALKKFKFLKKFRNLLFYFFSTLFVIVIIDFYVFKKFGHGFPSSVSEEKFERSPSPYDMFSGKPSYKDHNKLGFRGNPFLNNNKKTYQFAFFGGSTGYNGNPPISSIIENNLNQIISVKSYNFSSVSSNHNQHIHRLLKHSNINFDLVIFYGGYNETIQTFLYDPRPGYPFNYWIRNELSKIKYILLKYSAIYAEYEKQTGSVTNLDSIKNEINFLSVEWYDDLFDNYFSTIDKAKRLTEKFIEGNNCKSTKFVAFYQPISLIRSNENEKKIILETKKRLKQKKNLIDISETIDESFFTDAVHVNQKAKRLIADKISGYIKENLLINCN